MIALLAAAALAQPLVFGEQQAGAIDNGPAEFTVEVPQAGLLSVAVRTASNLDLVLQVTDEDGQAMEAGRADEDIGDDRGAEQLAVGIPWPGTYRVTVSELTRLNGGGFAITAGFAPMPALARDEPAHNRPSTAMVLGLGDSEQAQLDSESDHLWSWVKILPQSDGPVRIDVTANTGDLVLEQFSGSRFDEPLEESDQDLEGELYNERLTLGGKAGQPLWLRVRDRGDSGPLRFTVSASVPE